MNIKIINKSHHPLPSFATKQSAGMDLRANLESPVVLKPMQRMLVHTGLFMALPIGYFSDTDFVINDGERIAQMVVTRHEQPTLELVDALDETERGTGGYGHTGVK